MRITVVPAIRIGERFWRISWVPGSGWHELMQIPVDQGDQALNFLTIGREKSLDE
ncbi:MAG TPA: hypothetical protein VKB79_18410 [Bryobacteraceae bacterium]|nr:hypothetical protein [Bryobacteraceae bacterium]